MGLIAKEEAKRDPVPEGAHHAVCFGVVDLGTQPPLPGSKFAKREHKVLLMFELPELRVTFEREGVQMEGPRVISKDFTVSLHEKSGLRAFLKSWRGRQFTPEELNAFNLRNVLRANCVLNIVHTVKGSNRYADISSVMPLLSGMAKRAPESPVIEFDLDEHDLNEQLPSMLPKWVAERIQRCDEWQRSEGQGGYAGDEPPPHQDDDIPF